jgi:uncharacterized protein YjbI with pentapeptide repeats
MKNLRAMDQSLGTLLDNLDKSSESLETLNPGIRDPEFLDPGLKQLENFIKMLRPMDQRDSNRHLLQINPTIIINVSHPTNLSQINVTKTNVSQIIVNQTNISQSNQSQTNINLTNITKTNISQINVSQINQNQNNIVVNVTKSNVSHIDVSQSNVSQSNVSQSNMSQSNVSQINITKTNVSQINVSKTNISQINASHINVSKTNISQITENQNTRNKINQINKINEVIIAENTENTNTDPDQTIARNLMDQLTQILGSISDSELSQGLREYSRSLVTSINQMCMGSRDSERTLRPRVLDCKDYRNDLDQDQSKDQDQNIDQDQDQNIDQDQDKNKDQRCTDTCDQCETKMICEQVIDGIYPLMEIFQDTQGIHEYTMGLIESCQQIDNYEFQYVYNFTYWTIGSSESSHCTMSMFFVTLISVSMIF